MESTEALQRIPVNRHSSLNNTGMAIDWKCRILLPRLCSSGGQKCHHRDAQRVVNCVCGLSRRVGEGGGGCYKRYTMCTVTKYKSSVSKMVVGMNMLFSDQVYMTF